MEQTNKLPAAIALHDLSTFGRCALTVICPTLSVMGVQVCPVPTALLSTHTGGFTGFCMEDTSPFMTDALTHFQSLNLSFDAVYSGFLGSVEQIGTVERYLEAYPYALKLVDPVLGDDGILYTTVTEDLVTGMAHLCEKADVITPNITEAAFLLGEEAVDNPSEETVKNWLDRLSRKDRSVVITGIPHHGISNMGYDSKTGETFTVSSPIVGGRYPGTGDVFASVLLGSLLKGYTLKGATVKASDFTEYCIRQTPWDGAKRRNGVALETCLPALLAETKPTAP